MVSQKINNSTFAFFNHAAVAPLSRPAAQRLRQYTDQTETRGNVGADWYAEIENVRHGAAQLIGADSKREIAFVPNTSTGLGLVARGLDWREGDEVIITNVEYPANRYPWEDLQRLGVKPKIVEEDNTGRIPPERVIETISNRTRVVALSHVQYASGYRMDLRAIAEAVHAVGGYLCVDAIQSVGVVPVNVQELGIDFMAADGHKWMLAPEGAGIFYCEESLISKLHPAIIGWLNMVDPLTFDSYRFEFQPDARRFEPGTYNVPGILALGASIDHFLSIGPSEIWSRVEGLTSSLCQGLKNRGYRIFSPRQEGERSGIVVFEPSPESKGADQLVQEVAQQDIVVASRAGRIRVSPHFYNTTEQIDRLLTALTEVDP